MESEKTNKDIMTSVFFTVKEDATLQETFEILKKSLEESNQTFGLIVVDKSGRYSGLLTLADFMGELCKLYRDACDKSGKRELMAVFFNECELKDIRKISEIMSGKRLSVKSGDSFEKSCELILQKKLDFVGVVDEMSIPVGVITRRDVLNEVGFRMFS